MVSVRVSTTGSRDFSSGVDFFEVVSTTVELFSGEEKGLSGVFGGLDAGAGVRIVESGCGADLGTKACTWLSCCT